jgi:Lrp/AsnC family leucine-responsive transcriptional regulator
VAVQSSVVADQNLVQTDFYRCFIGRFDWRAGIGKAAERQAPRPDSRFRMAELDATDLLLVELLQQDARTSQAALAKKVGLAASSVNERIRKLEQQGYITGYHARLSSEAMGYELLAFVYVAWSNPKTEAKFLAKIADEAPIIEAHHVTGVWNYMLKVRVKNTRMLERLLANVIKAVSGVERTETIIVLSSVKETSAIPTREPEWA